MKAVVQLCINSHLDSHYERQESSVLWQKYVNRVPRYRNRNIWVMSPVAVHWASIYWLMYLSNPDVVHRVLAFSYLHILRFRRCESCDSAERCLCQCYDRLDELRKDPTREQCSFKGVYKTMKLKPKIEGQSRQSIRTIPSHPGLNDWWIEYFDRLNIWHKAR